MKKKSGIDATASNFVEKALVYKKNRLSTKDRKLRELSYTVPLRQAVVVLWLATDAMRESFESIGSPAFPYVYITPF